MIKFVWSRSISVPKFKNLEVVCELLTPNTKLSAHLGHALKWNIHGHTWDRCCHGSEFLGKGYLINNLSRGGANIR